MLDIRQISVDDFFDDPDTAQMLERYADECAIDELPRPIPHLGSYHALETTGAFHLFGAYIEQKIIGFMSVVMPIMPHYSIRIATMESCYVVPEARPNGTGLKLIKHVEQHVVDNGCAGILMTAPAGSRLEKLLSRINYRHSNTVFFKKL